MNTTTLKKLLKELESPDVSVRRNAIQDLQEADERAIYPLIKALRDDNTGVQDAAIQSLMGIGGEVVPYMIVPLLREESFLRNTALLILRGLGRVSVPLLYPLLKDKDDDIRKFALDLLGEIQQDVLPERILPMFRDPNVNVRASAVKAIGELKYGEAIFDVIKLLKDDEWVCFSALETLGKLHDETSVGPIAELLDTGSDALKYAAVETLGLIGSERASEALMQHISQPDDDLRYTVIRSLVQIGLTPSKAEVADAMLQMFVKNDDWDEKLIALRGLADIQYKSAIREIIDVAGSLDRSVPRDEERLMQIMDGLRRFGCDMAYIEVLSDPLVRFKGKVIAAEVVGDLGCVIAAPVLIKLLENDTRDVKRACITALSGMDSDEAKQALLGMVNDQDSHIRKASIRAMGRLKVADAFDMLMSRLVSEGEYFDVVEEIVKSLLQIDGKRLLLKLDSFSSQIREAIGRFSTNVDILIGLVSDEELNVRLSATAGLGRIDDKRAIEVLKRALKDEDSQVRSTAVMALAAARCCIDELKAVLKDEDMWTRLHAVRSLGETAMPELIKDIAPMLKDKELPVKIATIEALGTIGGPDALKALRTVANHKNEMVKEAASRTIESL